MELKVWRGDPPSLKLKMIMLYDEETTIKIVLRCYEYLQIRMRVQPRSINMKTQQHQKWVKKFIAKLPPSAGADFIWDFLLFQFYMYARQTHKQPPLCSWFLMQEAWRRYEEYEEGAFYYSRLWGSEQKFSCPVKSHTYTPVKQEVLDKERLRMSRISGPNFCVAKYGEKAYVEGSEMCDKCPFEKTCYTLFCNEGNLYHKLEQLPNDVSGNVKLRPVNSSMADYGEEDL